MTWINFLHLYQPAHTDAHIIQEATEKSYKRIVKALQENPNIKFTLNISGCLILRWEQLGYTDLIKKFKQLIENGQIEITGTAAYHPLIPLIPEKEAEYQIKENEEILKKHFGKNFKPRGFFLPEMAYNQQAGKLIKQLGYEWVILDEISATGKLDKIAQDKIYQDEQSGLKVIFRSRALSKTYIPDELPQKIKDNNIYISATDGELYGLRHEDKQGSFEKFLKNKNLATLTVSEFIDQNSKTELEKVNLINSNWETTEEDLSQNIPYALWYNKQNEIQVTLWQLANLAYDTLEKYKNDDNYYWAHWHLVRGFSSCTFWWASGKDFLMYGPISWSPDEIERGANELIRAIRALHDVNSRKNKIKAEELYIKIKKMVWEKHWNYYWKK